MKRISILFFLIAAFAVPLFAAQAPEGQPQPSGELKDGVRVIKVEAFRYGFKPDPIVVKLGEKVKLIATSTDVPHGLAIAEFKINEDLVKGKDEEIDFTADKKGTFTVYCSVYCGPGHSGMHGTLIVE